MKSTSLLRPKQIFVRISPRIAVGRMKYATWHPLRMRYKAVQVTLKTVSNEGHFTHAAETTFLPVSPLIAVG
jgi:hypothetical protein